MHQLPIEQQILLVAQIVVLVALCAKLWWDGLYKIYSWFFGYLFLRAGHPRAVFHYSAWSGGNREGFAALYQGNLAVGYPGLVTSLTVGEDVQHPDRVSFRVPAPRH